MRKLFYLAVLFLLGASALALSAISPSYRVAGDYFETCSCDPACPCIFGSDPSHHVCQAVLVWHIQKGSDKAVVLDGLNAAVALVSDGNMDQQAGKMRGVLYLDQRGTESQRKALEAIFRAQVGPFFADFPPARFVPVEFSHQNGIYTVRIPQIVEAKIELLKDGSGNTPQIAHAPSSIVNPVWVGRSVENRYSDPKLASWEYRGRSGLSGAFKYGSKGKE